MKQLRIFTTNWHVPYLFMLAQLGHVFIIHSDKSRNRFWDQRFRPLPQNVGLTEQNGVLSETIDFSLIDVLILHNLDDYIKFYRIPKPKILIFHNSFSTEQPQLAKDPIQKQKYINQLKMLLFGVPLVFISKWKQETWGLPGAIIEPGINTDWFDGFIGNLPKLLMAYNNGHPRNFMSGYDDAKAMFGDDLQLVGDNVDLNTYFPPSFNDYRQLLRGFRGYCVFNKEEYEDSYNLASLEAMATGQPIIQWKHSRAIFKDGEAGYITDNPQELLENWNKLKSDPILARKLGAAGREIVKDKFSFIKFLARWENVIRETI